MSSSERDRSHTGLAARPLIVVEGPIEAFDHAIREVSEAGWPIGSGFTDGPPGRSIHAGSVATESDAAQALLLALGGSGLIIRAACPRVVIDRLIDDLRRLGPVDHRIGQPVLAASLAPEARAILGLLAEGHSLGVSADILGLSRRTADRRLSEARRILGVERTTEAIAAARRRGQLGPTPADHD
jgi:DNA-binding CsgD family transcriptional regulator